MTVIIMNNDNSYSFQPTVQDTLLSIPKYKIYYVFFSKICENSWGTGFWPKNRVLQQRSAYYRGLTVL